MKYIPHLVTYPRSGSHYFDELIYKEINIHIEKSHTVDSLFDKNNKKEKAVITIVRDPIDSIASAVAYEHSKFTSFNWVVSDTRVSQIVTEYILMYNFLYDHADYIIDFNDLVKNPEAVTKRMLELLEISQEDRSLFDRTRNVYAKEYLPSSQKLPFYDKNRLDQFNMGLCYFYYNRLLEKRIKV